MPRAFASSSADSSSLATTGRGSRHFRAVAARCELDPADPHPADVSVAMAKQHAQSTPVHLTRIRVKRAASRSFEPPTCLGFRLIPRDAGAAAQMEFEGDV